MSRLVYSSLTDNESNLPVQLATTKLVTSKPATSTPATSKPATSRTGPTNQGALPARSRVRVIGSTVHVSGAVTALVIDRVCAAVDHLHSLGATGIRVEMDDAESSDSSAPVEAATPTALTG